MSGRFELRRDQLERGTGPDSETQAETNTETETEAISRRVLRLMGGGEALDVLLTSRERVEMDLDASLTMASMIASSDLTPRVSLAVREWVEVPLWTELRGFVVNGQLTALTQQDTRHPSPHLLRHKAQIERLIVQFSNTHLLPAMASVGPSPSRQRARVPSRLTYRIGLSSGVVDYGQPALTLLPTAALTIGCRPLPSTSPGGSCSVHSRRLAGPCFRGQLIWLPEWARVFRLDRGRRLQGAVSWTVRVQSR
mmetsp:Transcript_61777/g.146033  ORF Transcript_61777/g.146033 Transcript_61777/m.146033 type:complete len:253 (-) Transcript_61777:153-911(-)